MTTVLDAIRQFLGSACDRRKPARLERRCGEEDRSVTNCDGTTLKGNVEMPPRQEAEVLDDRDSDAQGSQSVSALGGQADEADETEEADEMDDSASFLSHWQAQKLPLVEKIVVSHDTRIFRLGLPDKRMKAGLPTGCRMFLRAKIGDEMVMRPYHPLTDDKTRGHVDLMVKVYFKGVHPKFPNGGKMSQHLESLQIGDTVEVQGPLGDFVYQAPGSYTWNKRWDRCKCINMIAGGSGLTPCHQVLRAILRNASDRTQVRLLYANKMPRDVLLRERLDGFAGRHPERFKVWYTVDRVPEGQDWKFSVGFINEAMIKAHLFPPDDDTITVMCGPEPMIQFACGPSLLKLGHRERTLMVL